MSLDMVHRICTAAAKSLPGATIIAPLPVWDGDGKSMGVQIKAPRQMGPQECEAVGSFVLSPVELASQAAIHAKAAMAVLAMRNDVQVQIRPVRAEKVA